MNKLLLLGSVVSPCPPLKQGGTERVVYYQAKQLALHGVEIILVGAKGSKENFAQLLKNEQAETDKILSHIEFIEIGGGTQVGNTEDSIKTDLNKIESSRKMRLESIYLTQVMEIIKKRASEYTVILNNMRSGEALFLPLASELKKPFFTVMHLNLFPELATHFKKYNAKVVTIGNHQREKFPNLEYAATIYNPIHTATFTFQGVPKDYALMMGTVGYHKNQKDAVKACIQANVPLVIAGKIRDQDYFDTEIKPWVDKGVVTYYGELDFATKLKLYQEAKVFLFPIDWQEPFGLVVIEALSCGTPVIAYPNGGPSEIIKDGVNGFLVNNVDEMAEKIGVIDSINRKECRRDVETRFDEVVIGKQYYETFLKYL